MEVVLGKINFTVRLFLRLVGGQRRKGNEEVGRAVATKRRAFEEWLQRRDRLTYDRYRPRGTGQNE